MLVQNPYISDKTTHHPVPILLFVQTDPYSRILRRLSACLLSIHKTHLQQFSIIDKVRISVALVYTFYDGFLKIVVIVSNHNNAY